MKKLLCLMLQLLVLLPLAAVLLPHAMSAEESGEDVVEFVLHKRMIRDIDYNDQFDTMKMMAWLSLRKQGKQQISFHRRCH